MHNVIGGFMRGLYIHIPFCNSLCKFCDFPKRIRQNEGIKKTYIKKIISDLKSLDNELCFDTVYIGGGTPNSLSTELLEELFVAINKRNLKPNFEFTIEVNFELINEDLIKLFKKYNINRISMGIQTFNKKIGAMINRQSSYELCKEKITLLNDYGITNINGDFIFGLPQQTINDVEEDLKLIKSLDFKHISYYSLILEDKSVLGYEIKNKLISLPDIDLTADMYELIQQQLKDLGFNQYEISNFSKANYESKHNIIYWELDEYYGIGMSAASFHHMRRFANSKLMREYLNDENEVCEEVSDGEFFWLGLRMMRGVSLTKYQQKYGINPYQKYPINDLIQKGLVELNEGYLRLTPLGLDHGNYVFECFL